MNLNFSAEIDEMSKKVEGAQTASEAMEVEYPRSFNFLGHKVWISIRNKEVKIVCKVSIS